MDRKQTARVLRDDDAYWATVLESLRACGHQDAERLVALARTYSEELKERR
jgi:hypothetical protein